MRKRNQKYIKEAANNEKTAKYTKVKFDKIRISFD